MNKESMKKRAIEILSCQAGSLEEIELSEHKAVYFRNTTRGGGAVIISIEGDMLFADPFFVDFDEHLKKFLDGERSKLD